MDIVLVVIALALLVALCIRKTPHALFLVYRCDKSECNFRFRASVSKHNVAVEEVTRKHFDSVVSDHKRRHVEVIE